ncbi:radical SAM protein [Candidatus Pacearchaeota archaeon]|nr:radical SAM protein [Candidatus Pacearchaeota archaeon]
MEILLVVPRFNLTNKKDYGYMFPLGLGYIYSVIRKKGFNINCINLNHYNGSIEENLTNELNKKKYDIILTGNIGVGYWSVEKITNTAKKHPTNPKIILGGTLITSEPTLMLKTLKPEFIVIGEGEITITELLDVIIENKDLNSVDGIGFFQDNNPVFTKQRKLIENIDNIPWPDFTALGYEEFLENQSGLVNLCDSGKGDTPRNYPLMCSRGCPFQCTFCYHSIGVKYRERTLDNIFEEINTAVDKYKINSLTLYDDLFSLTRERLFEFCKKIKEVSKNLPKQITWSCNLLVNNVDKEMLLTLKDAGCNLVSFGFESYSSDVLKSMKKPITPEKIKNAIKLTKEVKIGIQANFIFGDIAETRKTAKETLDFWKNYCDGQVQLGFIQPYPGSDIYKRCIQKGKIKDKLDFIKNNLAHTNWINMTDNMTDQDILDLKNEILKTRWKHTKYIIPNKKTKNNDNTYNLEVSCPFCNEMSIFKNIPIKSNLHYNFYASCKSCNMRFNISSKFYRFEMKHYQLLDPFRKTFLYIHDNLKKKNA